MYLDLIKENIVLLREFFDHLKIYHLSQYDLNSISAELYDDLTEGIWNILQSRLSEDKLTELKDSDPEKVKRTIEQILNDAKKSPAVIEEISVFVHNVLVDINKIN